MAASLGSLCQAKESNPGAAPAPPTIRRLSSGSAWPVLHVDRRAAAERHSRAGGPPTPGPLVGKTSEGQLTDVGVVVDDGVATAVVHHGVVGSAASALRSRCPRPETAAVA